MNDDGDEIKVFAMGGLKEKWSGIQLLMEEGKVVEDEW